MYIVLGIAALGLAAFLVLTLIDFIKYLLKKARDKKAGAESGASFPQTLKRNLIILPIGCAIVVALYFFLPRG